MRTHHINTRFDFKKNYNQSTSFVINQAVSNNSSNEQYRTTFGIQIYHKGLTQINYTINANFTYFKLRSDQIPQIKISSYEYDLDYYDTASHQINFTEFEVTDGISKHRDLIYINHESGAVEANNSTKTDGDNTIVSYNSISPRIVKKREFQKLYFTLVGDQQIPAEKCTLHLEILRGGEPVFTYDSQGNKLL